MENYLLILRPFNTLSSPVNSWSFCLFYPIKNILKLGIRASVAWETEIQSIAFPGQMGQERWVWWYIPVVLATAGSLKNKRIMVHASVVKKWDAISKINTTKRARGVVQVVGHLPCKCEDLSLNPIPPINKQTNKQTNKQIKVYQCWFPAVSSHIFLLQCIQTLFPHNIMGPQQKIAILRTPTKFWKTWFLICANTWQYSWNRFLLMLILIRSDLRFYHLLNHSNTVVPSPRSQQQERISLIWSNAKILVLKPAIQIWAINSIDMSLLNSRLRFFCSQLWKTSVCQNSEHCLLFLALVQ
jgi:hypothetical protein